MLGRLLVSRSTRTARQPGVLSQGQQVEKLDRDSDEVRSHRRGKAMRDLSVLAISYLVAGLRQVLRVAGTGGEQTA